VQSLEPRSRNKLAIITPGFYEQAIGGAEYQSYLFAKAAKEFGYQVYYVFIATDKSRKMPNHLGITLCPIFSPKYRQYIRGIGNTAITCIPATWKALNDIKPDFILCRSGVIQSGLGAYYARKCNAISIWQVASSNDLKPLRFLSVLRRPLDFMEFLSVRYAIKHSTIVLTQAEYQSKELREKYARDSIIFKNLVPETSENIARSEEFTVVWVGNIKPLKQPELFIQVAKILSSVNDMRFIMIGKPAIGKYQAKLERQISTIKNLSYLGLQSMSDVDSVLSKAHLLVNTSLYEGFPNTFIQAWIRGVPVISLIVNPDNVLTTFNIGCHSRTIDKMIKDLLGLYTDRTALSDMSQSARYYALNYHSYSKNRQRITEILS